MEFMLDIVIPAKEINKIDLKEQLVSWGEEIFSRDPPRYMSSSNLVFEQVRNLEFYNRLLNETLDENKYIALFLKDDSLAELERIVYAEKSLTDNALIDFLAELTALSEFYVFLLREDEPIKQRCAVKNKDELTVLLRDSISESTRKDILITN